MNSLIEIGTSLVPELSKLIEQDKDADEGAIAKKVIEAVTSTTGSNDATAAKAKLDADPAISTELRLKLAQIAFDANKVDPTVKDAASKRAGVESEEDRTADTSTIDARRVLVDLTKENLAVAWTPSILSLIVVVGFFGLVAALFKSGPNESSQQLINICVGTLATGFATVLNFWLGSSLGSRKKSERQDASLVASQIQQTPAKSPGGGNAPPTNPPASSNGSQ